MQNFWKRVNKTNTCWNWTGCTRNGYGAFKYNGKTCGTHRVSWIIHFGSITNGLCVLHKCDNRTCVNPDHLFLGTRLDNARDMVSKGRLADNTKNLVYANGAANCSAKLDEHQIKSIRKKHSEGISYAKLAVIFGVTKSTIQKIVNGTNWSHLL